MANERTKATDNAAPESRMNPRRVEWVALLGLGVQALAALALGLLAFTVGGRALGLLAVFSLVGIGFWLLGWLHLRLRRAAEEEADNLAAAERQRRMSGMERLFDDEDEVNQAARNLGQMDSFIAPAASIVAALALFALPLSYFLRGTTPWAALAVDAPIETSRALVGAAVAAGLAVVLFLCGMYAAGLARERRREVIRAGGGFMLVTALFSLLSAMALGLGGQQWKMAWPDKIVSGLILAWAAVQGLEILVNLILNIYRPRVPGVSARPAYDSRLSGLFAEPTGLVKTFAHTLDYQFGFKISETWFFQFLERAFAPLLLIWFFTFYLMTSLVVVRPGEAAIIERFGAPRGVTLPAPNAPDAEWDAISVEPKGPGLWLKWPWPIETARVLPRERIQLVYSAGGHEDTSHTDDSYVDDGHGHAAPEKKDDHDDPMKLISWDEEHGTEEFAYLMPKPASWIEVRQPTAGAAAAVNAAAANDVQAASPEDSAEIEGVKSPLPARRVYVPLPEGHSFDDGHDHSGNMPREAMRTFRRTNAASIDALLLSGTFSLQYRVGTRPGDLYRFCYRHEEPVKELEALFARELTLQMAGAEFWSLLITGDRQLQRRIVTALAPEVRHLGIELLGVQLQNVHPPAGDVGKAFQEVLAARQAKEAAVFKGWQDHYASLGAVEGRINETRYKAEGYGYERETVAKAEADRFLKRLEAYRVAPEVYIDQLRLQTIGQELGEARVVVHPPDFQVRIDGSRYISSSDMATLTGVGAMIASEAK